MEGIDRKVKQCDMFENSSATAMRTDSSDSEQRTLEENAFVTWFICEDASCP